MIKSEYKFFAKNMKKVVANPGRSIYVPLLVIIDGYDECQLDIEPQNLATLLEINTLPNAKLLVTCRPDTVPDSELKTRFAFRNNLIIRYFLPFNLIQMFNYLKTSLNLSYDSYSCYQKDLKEARELRIVLRNPFVLSLLVQSWETISHKDFKQLNRWQIYQYFVEHWIEQKRSLLLPTIQETLSKGHKDLLESFNTFAAEIAFAAFKEKTLTFNNENESILSYNAKLWLNLKEKVIAHSRDAFASRKINSRRSLLNEADFITITCLKLKHFEFGSPLKKRISSFEPSHKSFLEYFIARRIIDLREKDPNFIFHEGLQLLNVRSLQEEPETIRFIAEAWQEPKTHILQEPFFKIILSSRDNPNVFQASSDAITILNAARVSFSGMDLSNIQVSEADLSYGIFDNTNFENADLSNVILNGAWLSSANLQNSKMNGVSFGELVYTQNAAISSCMYSKDGCYFAAAAGTEIIIYKVKNSGNLTFDRKLHGHTDHILSIAFSQDSLWLASGSKDHSICLWELRGSTSHAIKKLTAHTAQVRSVVFSYGNQWLVSAGYDKKLCFWNIKDISVIDFTKPQNFLFSDNHILSVVFSQNNKWLALSDGKTISLYTIKVSNGDITAEFLKILTAPTELIPINIVFDPNVDFSPNMDFSPDSKWLASGRLDSRGDDSNVYIWKMEEILNGMQPKILTGHTSFAKSITFSPDNQWLASGSRDNTICFWSIEEIGLGFTKPKKIILGHNYSINTIAFSHNGKQLASGSDDKTVRTWNLIDIVNPRITQLQTGHIDYVRSVTFVGFTNQWFISGSGDKTVRVWNRTYTNKNQILLNNNLSVLSIALSPNYKYLAFSDDEKIQIWIIEIKNDIFNCNNSTTIKDNTKSVLSIAFSTNSQWLVSGSRDKTVNIYNIINENNGIYYQKKFQFNDYNKDVYNVTFSQNNKFFASGDGNGNIRLYSIEKNGDINTTPQELNNHTDYVLSVVFSPDNKWLASCSRDTTICLYSIEDVAEKLEYKRCQVLKKHSDIVRSVTFNANSQWLASGGNDKTICFWSISPEKTWIEKFVIKTEFNIYSLAYSPNQQEDGYIISGGGDYSVRCYKQEQEQVRLIWTSSQAILCANQANIMSAELSNANAELLNQRGTIGTPTVVASADDSCEETVDSSKYMVVKLNSMPVKISSSRPRCV